MPVHKVKSDQELLDLLKSHDGTAFTEIYNRYWAVLYRHARKMLQSDEEAKDVVQEVFTSLWMKANNHTIVPPLAAFLYTSTRNRILDLVKHLKVDAKYIDSLRPMLDDLSKAPDSSIIERELADLIETEIQGLPSKMRKVFELSRKEHKSYKEISDELNISDKTVKKQISNALQILKTKLGLLLTLF